ncbi:MAG: hypothetical protein K2N65_04785, partial [Anaeroplasmataceae bacterium]|nr:hypothetical protein [Anaeroplasmataceae bacterium]
EDYLAIKDHKKIVFCYASYGYKVAEEYDYKINSLEEITQVLPKIFYKEKILENVPYEIFSVKDSNCTVMYKDMICYFGFLETSTLENDCRLIEKLKKISKPLLGPMNGNTWYSYRISLNEFDFRLYPDCINDQTLLNLFLVAGFVVKDKYSSTLATINERIWERGKKIQLNSSYRIVQVHHEECYKYLDELYEVASLAFQNASYYEPISKEEFKTLYIKNIQLCQPDLVLIYYKESLVAFNFCYEDLEKRFYVCKTTAILPEHRSMKIILKLIDVSYQMMCSYGYKQVLYHFQNDQTKTLYPIFKDHILKQKFYGLLRYPYEK